MGNCSSSKRSNKIKPVYYAVVIPINPDQNNLSTKTSNKKGLKSF